MDNWSYKSIMARLSKYFTPVIQSSDRKLFTEILGLNAIDLSVIEQLEGRIINLQNWTNGKSTVIITNPGNMTNVNSNEIPKSRSITVEHRELVTEDKSGPTKSGFIGKLLPYPYSLVFDQGETNFNLRYSPTDFSDSLKEIHDLIRQLEARMADFELSVLWAKRAEKAIPLLFHFVRKELIRVGTLPTLYILAEDFKGGLLTPSKLRQFFGTQAAFFELNLDFSQHLSCPLQQIKASINRCLTNPQSRVIGESISAPESYFEPDLGL